MPAATGIAIEAPRSGAEIDDRRRFFAARPVACGVECPGTIQADGGPVLDECTLRERVVGCADFDDKGVDNPWSHPNPRPGAPLGQGVVRRLVPIGLAVEGHEDVDRPVAVLEPFGRPHILGAGDAAGHLRDSGPVFEVCAGSDGETGLRTAATSVRRRGEGHVELAVCVLHDAGIAQVATWSNVLGVVEQGEVQRVGGRVDDQV